MLLFSFAIILKQALISITSVNWLKGHLQQLVKTPYDVKNSEHELMLEKVYAQYNYLSTTLIIVPPL